MTVHASSSPVYRTVKEVFLSGSPGFWTHPEWRVSFPWLAQGTTGRKDHGSEGPRDFAVFTDPPAPGAHEAWERLGSHFGFIHVVHSRQLHGNAVLIHGGEQEGLGPEGLGFVPGVGRRLALGSFSDGHITGSKGILLGVTVADCVPVFLVDPENRGIGLLHAGWRGTVAGILERGVELLGREFGTAPEGLHAHLGPAICGECYEVGPEVHRALGLSEPEGPQTVDLRACLAHRAEAAGIEAERISVSGWCTLCQDSPFYSHRRGEGGRQAGFLGILP